MNRMDTTPLLLGLLFAIGFLIEVVRERSALREARQFPRLTAMVIGMIAVALTIVESRGVPIQAGGLAMGPIVTGHNLRYASSLTFHGKYISTVVSLVLFLGGVFFAPSIPLVRVRMSRVFLMQGLLIGLIQATTVMMFLVMAASLLLVFIMAVDSHSKSLKEDDRADIRAAAFRGYQGLAVLAISGSITLRVLDSLGLLPVSAVLEVVDMSLLCLAAAIASGIFPFHAWVVPFLGSPRSTVFLPLLCIETGLVFFLRIYAPIVARYHGGTMLFLWVPAFGLVYAALLFFSERRLKRIPGYLYLSHISLMATSSIGFGKMGMTVSMLDAVNVLVAVLGLMGVCALLTSRFGVRGVLAPSGLGALFPELAVCYLICVFSLVGFPGTLGFINEEVMLGQGLEHHSLLVGVIAFALTLNGFSSFRLFARIFYGQPFEGRDSETALLLRERVVIICILALIVLNGIAPEFLIRALTDLGT